MPTAGLDEAGCGALMGDLVAAAVVLGGDSELVGALRDSKKLTPHRREVLATRIRATCDVGIGSVSPDEIDARGMAWARRVVFHRALDALATAPDALVVDGTIFEPYRDIPHQCVPRADATVPAVSAASIIAKTTRDARVSTLCTEHPDVAARYAWASNKGYPAPQHLGGIRTHGVTEWHRRSFGPCKPNARVDGS